MREQQDGHSIVLQPVESAARQLVQLSLHYLVNQPGRICAAGQETPLPDAAAIGTSPRMVAFVGLDKLTNNVSSASLTLSPKILTATVCVVVPGAKLRIPLVAI